MFGRKKNKEEDGSPRGPSGETERTLTPGLEAPTKAQIKRATRTRLIWTTLCSFLLVLTVIFLILVEVGQTSASSSARNKIYFLNLDLSDIVPTSVPDASVDNSIAQTLGLHDFYRVGLWGFCEGYTDGGVSDCSTPKSLYWFDPVSILLNELLAGATITLPAELTSILNLLRIVSHWMFGLFISGAVLSFVMIFVQFLSVYSRWTALVVMFFTFWAALLTTVATIIATILFIIFRNAVTSVTELNIGASLGTEMFVFMWIAASTSIIAWIIQMSLCCCCASRRDVKRGKKKGSKKAWNTETVGLNENMMMSENGMNGGMGENVSEKPPRRSLFGRKAKNAVPDENMGENPSRSLFGRSTRDAAPNENMSEKPSRSLFGRKAKVAVPDQ